jgi:hypothetical protein
MPESVFIRKRPIDEVKIELHMFIVDCFVHTFPLSENRFTSLLQHLGMDGNGLLCLQLVQ